MYASEGGGGGGESGGLNFSFLFCFNARIFARLGGPSTYHHGGNSEGQVGQPAGKYYVNKRNPQKKTTEREGTHPSYSYEPYFVLFISPGSARGGVGGGQADIRRKKSHEEGRTQPCLNGGADGGGKFPLPAFLTLARGAPQVKVCKRLLGTKEKKRKLSRASTLVASSPLSVAGSSIYGFLFPVSKSRCCSRWEWRVGGGGTESNCMDRKRRRQAGSPRPPSWLHDTTSV